MRIGMNISIVPAAPSSMTTASGQASGATSRRTIAPSAIIATPSGSSGAMPADSFSAQAGPANGRRMICNPAIGRSTSRDQWMLSPPGGFRRYWVRSHQLCPASQARTCMKRILSSVSLSPSHRTLFQRCHRNHTISTSQASVVQRSQCRSSVANREAGAAGSFNALPLSWARD